MPPPIHPAAERRVRWLLRLLLIWGVCVLARLFYLQIVKHDFYADLAEQQQTKLVEIQAHRGTIYDRNGHILAISVPVETVVVNPSQLPNADVAAALIGDILGLDQKTLAAALKQKAAEKRGYFKVAERVSQDQAKRLKSLRMGWIQFESSSIRVYPNDQLASHVLGGVDHEKHGNGGIEQGMDDELSGRAGYASVVTDVRHHGLETSMEVEPVSGNDIVLTIDYRVEHELEKSLAAAVVANDCQSGRGLVMDARTGEILAMSSFPTYNPNERAAGLEARQNTAIQSATEPGSVFKVFTVAGAIEDGKVKPQTGYFCGNGKLNLFGRIIRDSHPHGYLSVEDILAQSSNIGAIHVSQELGEQRFFEYIKAFGFGSRTGLPLPGESSGRVMRLSKWTKSSIGSVAMGHEIMVTTAQLGQALSVIASGGSLIQPKLIRKVMPPQAEGVPLRKAGYEIPTAQPKVVLSPEAVVQMRKMLEHVVLAGTGKDAKVPGYSVGGKTGSAQMYDPKTKQYSHRLYYASFMGFAPVNDPRLIVVISLTGSTQFGGKIAGPVFRDVTGAALRILNVPSDQPIDPRKETLTGESANDVSFAELTAEKPVEISENSDAEVTKATLVTPNLMGKTLRAALEESAEKGFRIDPSGTGLVRSQSPAPGEPVAYGQKIKLKFGR